MQHAAARSHDRAVGDRHARSYPDVAGYPYLSPDTDGTLADGKEHIVAIVVRRAQVRVLGHDSLWANGDRPETVERDVITDPAVIPEADFPWIGDLDTGPDANAPADLCSESAQHPTAQPVQKLWQWLQECLHAPPQLYVASAGAAKACRYTESIESLILDERRKVRLGRLLGHACGCHACARRAVDWFFRNQS